MIHLPKGLLLSSIAAISFAFSGCTWLPMSAKTFAPQAQWENPISQEMIEGWQSEDQGTNYRALVSDFVAQLQREASLLALQDTSERTALQISARLTGDNQTVSKFREPQIWGSSDGYLRELSRIKDRYQLDMKNIETNLVVTVGLLSHQFSQWLANQESSKIREILLEWDGRRKAGASELTILAELNRQNPSRIVSQEAADWVVDFVDAIKVGSDQIQVDQDSLDAYINTILGKSIRKASDLF